MNGIQNWMCKYCQHAEKTYTIEWLGTCVACIRAQMIEIRYMYRNNLIALLDTYNDIYTNSSPPPGSEALWIIPVFAFIIQDIIWVHADPDSQKIHSILSQAFQQRALLSEVFPIS